MLDAVFTCPWCTRIFLQQPPGAGPIPAHLDALLGTPCAGSGRRPPSILELPGHEDEAMEWPAFPN